MYDSYDVFLYRSLDDKEQNSFQLKSDSTLKIVGQHSICDHETFLTNFDAFTCGQLAFIDWSNVIVGGGTVTVRNF